MLDKLTVASFSDSLGDQFHVPIGESLWIDLTLMEAKETRSVPRRDGSAPFSLIFQGPMRPILPQQIHRLEHPALGALELFMVPVGPDQSGMCYQVVFN